MKNKDHFSILPLINYFVALTGKAKPAALRNLKKESDSTKQNEFDDSSDLMTMKSETTQQDFDGEEEDDEFSHDGYSHSINSLQSTSLPPTPEPRNETPTLHTTRPSSKSSSFSITSHNSAATTASPPPERKATSYISVRFDVIFFTCFFVRTTF